MKLQSGSSTAALSVVAAVVAFVGVATALQVQGLAHAGYGSAAAHPHTAIQPPPTARSDHGTAQLRSATEISITSQGFEPSVVTTTVGSEVVWRNVDSQTHRISSGLLEHRVYVPLVLKNYSGGISSPTSADSGVQAFAEWESLDIPPGESYSRTFDAEGIFPYRCEYHPWHTGMVVVRALPDLLVEGIATDPATPLLGHPFSLTVAIRNQGTLDAEEGFWVDWYADPESPPTSDQQGDIDWWQDGLAANTTAVLSDSHTLYASGEHTLYAQVDTSDTVEEGEEGNNLSQPYTLTVVAPDLIVQSIATDPITLTVDLPFTVTVTVANQGDGDALEDFRVDWYAHLGSPPISTTVGNLQWWQSGLGPGQTATLQEMYTFDTPGEHTLYAQVDRDDLVMEDDEGNNITDPLLVTAARPDLVVQSISTDPETPIANFPFSLTVTVANQSDGSAEDTFAVDWYADPAVPPTSTTPSDGFWQIAGLDPWQQEGLSDTHTFLTEGEHVLYAQVDAADLVTESNESNNVSSPLTVNVTSNVVEVCGTINQNTVWHSGMVYVVTCDSTVASGVTLTIEPNVVVKFNYHVGLTVNGTLLAQGTQAAPIILTANTGTLTPGYWDGITFGSSSVGSIVDHVDIGYGGYSSSANVRVNTAQLTIANSTLHHGSSYGVYGISLSGITISNTEFMTNTNYAAYLSLTSGTFSGGNNTGSGNGFNGIAIYGSFGQDTTLPLNPGLPYIIPSGFTVNQGVTLTVPAGQVMKMSGSSLHVYGTLLSQGTTPNPVYVTSIKDDSVGGDTNSDGSATSPAAGDWYRIYLHSSGTVRLDHTLIRYAGGTGYSAALTLSDSAQATLNHTKISQSNADAIELRAGSGQTVGLSLNDSVLEDNRYTAITASGYPGKHEINISSSTIRNNGSSGVYITQIHSISMHDSSIHNNGGYGVYCEEAYTGEPINRVDLTNNTFTDNSSYAVYLYYWPGVFVSLSDNSGSGNGYNGIAISGSLGQDTVLPLNPGFPYIIPSSDLTVNEGVTLTLPPGQVIKMDDSYLSVAGTLLSRGTVSNPVAFTSLKDDSYGGDTNNDGSATSPTAGDWKRVSIYSTGTANLAHTVLRYGSTALRLVGSSQATLDHTTISQSNAGAINLCSDSDQTVLLTLNDSILEDNQDTAIVAGGWCGHAEMNISSSTIRNNGGSAVIISTENTTSIHDSTISGNAGYGVYSDRPNRLDLTNNTFTNNTSYAVYLSCYSGSFGPISANSGSGNGYNGIAIAGSLGQDTTLGTNPGFPYIVPSSDLTVNEGVTLTLPAGQIVKMMPASFLWVEGTLLSQGTVSNPVYFTSVKDDSIGGDTNNDGAATSPTPGDWQRLFVFGTANLHHTLLRYGGSDSATMLYLCARSGTTAHLSLVDSTVEDSASYGIHADWRECTGNHEINISSSVIRYNGSSGIYICNPNSTSIHDSDIYENDGYGVYNCQANAMNLTNNTFTNNTSYAVYLSSDSGTFGSISTNSGSGNGYNGIAIGGSLGQDTTLGLNSGFPYIITPAHLTVNEGVTLTLPAGQVIKMMSSWDMLVRSRLLVRGTVLSQGTASSPVYFTSIKDDSVGGDTNNDGAATSPAPGDWHDVYVSPTGTATSHHTLIQYAGGHFYSALFLSGSAQATLNDTTISDSSGYAIKLSATSGQTVRLTLNESTLEDSQYGGLIATGSYGNREITISSSIIRNNGGSGIYVEGPNTTSIHDCAIYDNGGYGVRNGNTSLTIDAENNWWGHESGPSPYGSGNGINYESCYDSVTKTYYVCEYYVDADPWLGQGYWVEHHLGQEIGWNAYEAEPVNTANGNYFYSRSYFNIPTRGLLLELTVTYNSAAPDDGPLGYGWTHGFNLSATENISDSTVIITYGDGRQDKFTWDGVEYVPPPGTFSTLTKDGGGFHLTEKDQTVYNFDSSGHLATAEDKNGNTTSLSYSGDDLVTVTEPAGRALDFTYASGRVGQVEDLLGRTVQFTYDGNGDLVTITDPRGYDLTFTYDIDHRLLTATDANGHSFVQNTYDSAGRVSEQRDAKGNLTSFAYDEVDHVTIVTDPVGNVTTYTYDDVRRLLSEEDPLSNTIRYTYDENNSRTTVDDKRANTTYYAYDDGGNVTVITDTLGYVTTITYDSRNNLLSQQDKLGRTAYYGYDACSNLTVVTDTLGYLTNIAYYSGGSRNGLLQAVTNARGNTTTYDYDAYSNLLSTTDELGYTSWQYHDLAGRLTESEDAHGFRSYYEYDDANNLRVITDTLAYVTQHSYDDVGNRISMVDAYGECTYYAYDEKDLLVTITDTLAYTTTYTYDANDNRLTVTDGNGHTTTYTYDKLNRLKTIQDALGHTVTYGYDANDNRTTVTNALGFMTGYAYDALDRLTSVTDPLIHSTYYGYDSIGNRTVITDANGIATNYTYDALDRLIGVTDAEGGAVSYGYDEVGNRTVITDANLHLTDYTYDPLDRVVGVTDPEGNTTSYGYDETGNRTVITDANSAITHFAFDSENRLTSVAYPDSTVSFSYDGLDSRLVMTDTTGITTYEYDALSRPLTITHPSGVVGYRYDALNRTQMIYPDGEVVTYTYDLSDRLDEVEDWDSRTVTYGYDNADRLTSLQYPNSTSASYSYDNADRLTNLTNSSVVSGTLSTFTYTLDDVGNRLQMVDVDGTTSYSYDDLYRLTQVDCPVGTPATVSYTYDAMGNRTVMTTTSTITYTYDTADRLLASGPITFTWDNNGNMLSKGDITYSYDYANRLVEVISGTQTITFTYNGDGVRVGKCVDGTCTTYLQDVAAPLPVVLVDTTGGQDSLYTYGLDLVAMTDPSSAQSYYHYDGLGSTRNLSNGTGQGIASYTYDAFGAVRSTTGSSGNEFTFTGEQADDEFGLIYLRARYYDPDLGRFTSRDWLPGIESIPQTLNRYPYVRNNPVNATDPRGELEEIIRSVLGTQSAMYGNLTSILHSLSHTAGNDLLLWDRLYKTQLLLKVVNPLYRMGVRWGIPGVFKLQASSGGMPAMRSLGQLSQLIPLTINACSSVDRIRRGEIDSPEEFFGEVFAFSANTLKDIITGPGRALAKLTLGEEAVANSPIRYLDEPVTGQQVVDLIQPIVAPIGEKYVQPALQPAWDWSFSVARELGIM